MEDTKKEIDNFMQILKDWGLTQSLSKNEVDLLKQKLHDITSNAVLEVKHAYEDVFFNMYNQIKTNK